MQAEEDVAVEVAASTDDPPVRPVRPRDRTPDTVVQNFDGSFTNVYGRDVRSNYCTREVFNFAVTAVLLLGVTAVAITLLGVYGFNSDGSEWLKAIISFCIGVFVPNPSLKAPTPPNAPSNRQHV